MKPFRLSQLPWRPTTNLHSFQHSQYPWRKAQWTARRCYRRSSSYLSAYENESRIEKIKVHRKFFTWRRLGLFVLYTAGPYFLLGYALDRLLDGEDLEEKDDDEDEDEEADEDEATGEFMTMNTVKLGDKDSIFIPLQYPRKLPPRFYKASDPEWLEFVSISHNEERKQRVLAELAAIVTRDLAKFPRIKQALGKNVALNKYWLNIKFPDGPPADYSRKGLHITDDYIAWSTQIIPSSHYLRLHHIMWPRVVCDAAWMTVKVFASVQAYRFKNAIGANLNQRDKSVKDVLASERSLRNLLKQKDDKSNSSHAPDSPNQSNSTSHGTDSRSTGTQVTSARPTTVAATAPVSQSPESKTTININAMGLNAPVDIAISLRTFLSSLTRNWSSSRVEKLPRGAFSVVGQVEVMGARGRVMCEVYGAYDPKASKYVFVTAKVLHYWELSQRAKGGP